MLKKVGIVAAAATAAMIALSPLAFADHDDDYDGEVTNVWIDDESDQRNQSNECEFNQEVSNSSALVPVELLVVQDQSGSCVNTGDDAEVEEDEVEPAPAPPVVAP